MAEREEPNDELRVKDVLKQVEMILNAPPGQPSFEVDETLRRSLAEFYNQDNARPHVVRFLSRLRKALGEDPDQTTSRTSRRRWVFCVYVVSNFRTFPAIFQWTLWWLSRSRLVRRQSSNRARRGWTSSPEGGRRSCGSRRMAQP